MKKTSLFISLVLLAFAFNSCNDNTVNEVTNDPVPSLTADEIEDLTFTREEEKLARDVYTYAYAKYGLNIFKNIASSEQTHMDRMGDLIETYDLVDPITNDAAGLFNNTDLQDLYATLIARVDESLVEALQVGATIEDLDIKDLNEAIARVTQSDIQSAYEMLKCGSGNHFRGFVGQIQQQGSDYTPQYVSEAEYQQIINGEHEHCGQ